MLYDTCVGTTGSSFAVSISRSTDRAVRGSPLLACALATAFQAASASDTPSNAMRPSTTRPSHFKSLSFNARARATSPHDAHASKIVSSIRDCATRGACHVTPISSRHFSPLNGTSFFAHFKLPATYIVPFLPTPIFPLRGPRPFSHASSNSSASRKRPALPCACISAQYAGAPAPHPSGPSNWRSKRIPLSRSPHLQHAPITAPIVILRPFVVSGIGDCAINSSTSFSFLRSPKYLIRWVKALPR